MRTVLSCLTVHRLDNDSDWMKIKYILGSTERGRVLKTSLPPSTRAPNANINYLNKASSLADQSDTSRSLNPTRRNKNGTPDGTQQRLRRREYQFPWMS